MSAGPAGSGAGRGIKVWEVKVWDGEGRHWVKRYSDRDQAWGYYHLMTVKGFSPMIPLPVND